MAEKYKVLFLSSWYPTNVSPMNGDFVKRHAKAVSLHSKVICLHVIKDANLELKYKLQESFDDNLYEVILYFNRKRFSKLNYLFYYFYGYKYIKQKFGKPGIIHANVHFPIGLIVFLLSYTYKIPYIFSEHWTGFLNGIYNNFPKIKKLLFNYFVKKAQCISPVTANLKDAMIRAGIKGNYKIVPNVVETDLFKPLKIKMVEKKRILHVSDLGDEHKNVSGLLRTISELSKIRQDFILYIVHSEENTQLKKLSDSLGLTDKYVKFCGKKGYDEVAEYMAKSVFLVLFSNYENLPCVIIEAFAAGIPVLSTDVGGINEHLNNERGILIPHGDEGLLLEKMAVMLDSYQSYNKDLLRDYAVSNFSYKVIGYEFNKIYQSILNV